MKVICALALLCFAAASASPLDLSILSETVGKLVTIVNTPVKLLVQGASGSALGDLNLAVGDQLDLSEVQGEAKQAIGQIEKILLRQSGGVVNIVLKVVTGAVFEVVEIVPSVLSSVTSGRDSTLSLANSEGKGVPLDISKVSKLVLKQVNSSSDPASLILSFLN